MKSSNLTIVKQVSEDQQVRRAVVQGDHIWFFSIYFNHYVKYQSAKFHADLFKITEDMDTSIHCVTAFRNCAKTTIITLSYPIWAILGKQKKKFVVIVSQTQRQAKMHLQNIKREFEGNELLRMDLGPFHEVTDEWGAYSLVLPRYKAKIMAVSMEQTIRGYRFGQHRPDLIIADDVENLDSIKTKEGRDKTYNWITGEIIPAGDKDTKVIFVGNLLHEDCLLMRLKEKISLGHVKGNYLEIPLIDRYNQILWPGKYPTIKDIEEEHQKTANEVSWQREYLLNIVPEEGQIITTDMIEYYQELPAKTSANDYRGTYIAVDPASSLKTTADYTAIVSISVFGYGENLQIYVLPQIVNKRMTQKEILEEITRLSNLLEEGKHPAKIFVEDTHGQKYLIQELKRAKYPVEGVTTHGKNKRERLTAVSHLIEDQTVKFPSKGTEILITELIGFGKERHDDLVDSLTMALGKILMMSHKKVKMGILGADSTGLITMMNGKEIDPPRLYWYLGAWHTEPPEDYYRRMQGYLDRGLF